MSLGGSIERIDALDKVLGKAQYAGDIKLEGMLYGCILRSPRPHAVIKAVDSTRAMALAGVVKVITFEEIPGENLFGIIKKDQPYLAHGRVYHIGQPILIVVAESEIIGRKALKLIHVEYEDIPAILDPFAARDRGLAIHEGGNLLSYRQLVKGDIDRGFREADVIVEHTYRTTWIDHAFMETEAGVGYMAPDGRITIMSSTQNTHYKRREVARLLGLPEEQVRIVQTTTGGGFGGKLDVTVEGYVALAVYHTRRPVLIKYTREESFLANTKRHPMYIEYKTGARKDGRITAAKVSITGDTGAFISYGEVVCLRVAIHAAGPYEVPNIHVESRMFYTNNPVSGAMRGFGVPQLAFAHESQMDEIARLIQMDPLDIRMANGLRQGSIMSTGQVLEHSAGFLKTLKAIEPVWRERQKSGPTYGFGLGCMYYGIGNTGASNPSDCYLSLAEEGKILFHNGACDMGQGSDTVLMQIVREALKVREDEVILVGGDTDTSNDAGSSSASRQTYISGASACDAAAKMTAYLKSKGYYSGNGLKEIYRLARDEDSLLFKGHFDPPTTPVDPHCQGTPYATYAFATHMTEVEVDETTGVCRVKRVHAAHDVGRAINETSVRGQIYGGVAMGIGLALMEEFVPGKTESFDDYYMPTVMDMPDVEITIVEEREPTGPFGAKGVGEPALIPQAASIVNAIHDAAGVETYELPCHVERLKRLIEDKKGNG
jgi:nicotinate dehydrogenase large molybdopterin subunit